MKSVLPFRGDDTLMYSITYDLVTPESASEGDYAENGYVVEPTEGELQDILLEANRDYGIYKPVGVGVFVNTQVPEDKDYFEKGHEKYYTLTITKSDGSKLNQEELDFVTALLNEGKYYFDEESNRFYEWGGTPEYGIGGWIGGTLIGGFLGYQVGKAVGYGRAVRGYEGGGEIEKVVNHNGEWKIYYGKSDWGNPIHLSTNRGDIHRDITFPTKQSAQKFLKSSDDEQGRYSHNFMVKVFKDEGWSVDSVSDYYEGGGEVIDTFTSIQGSRVMPNNPFTIEKENKFYVIKNSKGEVLAKDTTKDGIMKDKGMFLNLYEGGGDIPSDYFDFQTVQYNNGGEVRYFNRHENMGNETRREILEYTQYPILKEYFGKDGKDDTEYEEISRRLKEVNYDTGFGGFTNYLYGMFDGYDYSKTKDFQDELAKIKKADPKFHSKIMRIVEEIQSYPTTEQPNNNQFGLGGLLLAGGFGAYVGYKVGRARPQKKGFDTEKKVANKIKGAVKDVTSKKKPAKAYEGGGEITKQLEELENTHEKIRRILMDSGAVEYGDFIIDDISEAVGMSNTNAYYTEDEYYEVPKKVVLKGFASEKNIQELENTHEKIRRILMDSGAVEYGDFIIDDISEAVGIPTTNVYYEEGMSKGGSTYQGGGEIQATSEYTFNELYEMPYSKLEKYFMQFYGYDGREEFDEMYENQFEGKSEKQKKEILIDNFKDYNYSGKFAKGGSTYQGGGKVVSYKYYDKDDYDDSVTIIKPNELKEFLDDWNSTMETNYKNAKEFNAGEDYYVLEEIYYGGGETITKPRPTITPTETPSKPDKDNPYLPKVKPKPKASKLILTK